MSCSVLTITLALAFTLLCVTEGAPRPQYRCRCVKSESEIPKHRIVKVEKYLPGPHCNHVEVIATIKIHKNKEQQVCLNPKTQWVQDLLTKWNYSEQKVAEAAN